MVTHEESRIFNNDIINKDEVIPGLVGDFEIISQIPCDLYQKGTRVLIKCKDRDIKKLNYFVTNNYLNIISITCYENIIYSILEFKEDIEVNVLL